MIRAACVAIAGLSLGLSLLSCASRASGSSEVSRGTVRRGDLVQRIVLTGEFDAHRSTVIAVPRNPAWQTTIRWLAPDGSDVKKGDRIAELDSSALTSTLEERRTSLREAEHALAQKIAELRASLAESRFAVDRWTNDLKKARLKASVPRELIAGRDADERELEVSRCEKELAKAMENLRAAQVGAAADQRNLEISLALARDEITRAERAVQVLTLTAPEDGTIIFMDHPWEGRKLQVGDRVWVGFPIAKIPDLTTTEVLADLWDVDDGRIAVGDAATVTIDAWPTTNYDGRIVMVAPVAQEGARRTLRRSFRTIVALDRIDASRMRPGLSTKIEVRRTLRRAVLLVGREFVMRKNGRTYVRADGRDREVKLAACNSRECAVDRGLEEGTKLTLAEAEP